MILLTFNVKNHREELKNGMGSPLADRTSVTVNNCETILRILGLHEIKCTFFISSSIFKEVVPLLKTIIGKGHEVALFNEDATESEISSIAAFFVNTFEKSLKGIRQREFKLSSEILKNLGFNYISNIEDADLLFPFKRLERTTKISVESGITVVPESISPYLQLPYNDFVFQLLPQSYYSRMVNETLKTEEFVQIYLETSQFTDLKQFPFKVPLHRKFNLGKPMADKLQNFIEWTVDHELACARVKDYIF